MNAKQIQKLLTDAQATVDEKFLLLPRSQRSASASEQVNKIKSARAALSAAAYRNFDAAIAANDVPAAREWQKIAGMSATMSPTTVEMNVEDAIAEIQNAVAVLNAM